MVQKTRTAKKKLFSGAKKALHKPNTEGIGKRLGKQAQERTEKRFFELVKQGDRKGLDHQISRLEKAHVDLKFIMNAKDSINVTLLMYAAGQESPEICSLLLEKGADAGIKDGMDRTALQRAAYHGRFQNCKLIIEEYAKAGGDAKGLIASGDHIGTTPLHFAAQFGYTQSCAALMGQYKKAGGNVKDLVSAKDNSGWTALMHAAMHGRNETAAFLKSMESR